MPKIDGQFKEGQSGNKAGRPRGSKNRLSGAFRDLAYDAFIELGGKEWIKSLAKTKRNHPALLAFFSKLLPKDISIEAEKDIPLLVIQRNDGKPTQTEAVGFEQPVEEKPDGQDDEPDDKQ